MARQVAADLQGLLVERDSEMLELKGVFARLETCRASRQTCTSSTEVVGGCDVARHSIHVGREVGEPGGKAVNGEEGRSTHELEGSCQATQLERSASVAPDKVPGLQHACNACVHSQMHLMSAELAGALCV